MITTQRSKPTHRRPHNNKANQQKAQLFLESLRDLSKFGLRNLFVCQSNLNMETFLTVRVRLVLFWCSWSQVKCLGLWTDRKARFNVEKRHMFWEFWNTVRFIFSFTFLSPLCQLRRIRTERKHGQGRCFTAIFQLYFQLVLFKQLSLIASRKSTARWTWLQREGFYFLRLCLKPSNQALWLFLNVEKGFKHRAENILCRLKRHFCPFPSTLEESLVDCTTHRPNSIHFGGLGLFMAQFLFLECSRGCQGGCHHPEGVWWLAGRQQDRIPSAQQRPILRVWSLNFLKFGWTFMSYFQCFWGALWQCPFCCNESGQFVKDQKTRTLTSATTRLSWQQHTHIESATVQDEIFQVQLLLQSLRTFLGRGWSHQTKLCWFQLNSAPEPRFHS